MNPYLEQSDYWSDFHNHLIAALALELIPLLLPKYRVVTVKWVYKVSGMSTIPPFELPIQLEDTAPIVDLQKLVNELYAQLEYDYFINYSDPPPPPWSESDVAQWLCGSG